MIYYSGHNFKISACQTTDCSICEDNICDLCNIDFYLKSDSSLGITCVDDCGSGFYISQGSDENPRCQGILKDLLTYSKRKK